MWISGPRAPTGFKGTVNPTEKYTKLHEERKQLETKGISVDKSAS